MNTGYAYREQVGSAAAGRSVLAWLTERHRHSSEAVWRGRLLAGEVELDGRVAHAGQMLSAGRWLVWRRPPWREPEVPLAFAVLYRDAELLAVAKPRGLPTLPGGGYLTHTLLQLVRRSCPEATPLHRLGRGTSGLVLFARTPEARRAISAAWRGGQVEKEYLAHVEGEPASVAFSVETPIGLVPHPRLGHVHAASATGRAAVSHVRLLAVRERQALVAVSIPTGRPHQIRIHLAAAGHPLVGDPLYGLGGLPCPEPGLPGDLGYRLHAHRLRFAHPTDRHAMLLECAAPLELQPSTFATSIPSRSRKTHTGGSETDHSLGRPCRLVNDPWQAHPQSDPPAALVAIHERTRPASDTQTRSPAPGLPSRGARAGWSLAIECRFW